LRQIDAKGYHKASHQANGWNQLKVDLMPAPNDLAAFAWA